MAKVGSGEPVTQEIREIKVNENFYIYDTKGIERKDYEATIGEVKDFIIERAKKPQNEQIHIVWLCIQEPSRRVEQSEKELYEFLKDGDYTTMIVITKANQDKDPQTGEKFSDIVKRYFNVNDEHIERTIAIESEDDDGKPIPLKGINKLIEKTYDKLEGALKSAFAREQKYNKELRRNNALEIINYYSAAAGAVTATPIPFSDIALILPTQLAMITHISKEYGLNFNADDIKKVVVAFTGVAAGGIAARAIVGNLVKFIPGIGSIAGGVINGTMAVGATKLMGNAYLAYLEDNFDLILSGGFDLSGLTPDIIKALADRVK